MRKRKPVRRDPRVRVLAEQFDEFRRTHEPRTRIPDQLRDEALATLAAGVPGSVIRSACGLGSGQLENWEQRKTAGPAVRGAGEPGQAVPVVEPGQPAAAAARGAERRAGEPAQVVPVVKPEKPGKAEAARPAVRESSEAAQVFSVVEPAEPEVARLELRLGAWSVTVRLDGTTGR
jgi:hypothetical protein